MWIYILPNRLHQIQIQILLYLHSNFLSLGQEGYVTELLSLYYFASSYTSSHIGLVTVYWFHYELSLPDHTSRVLYLSLLVQKSG